MVNILERLFPTWGLKRRMAADALRTYEAARPGPTRPNLWGGDLSANAILEADAPRLRQYARFLDENSDNSVSVLDTLVNGIVGTGILVIPAAKTTGGELAEAFNSAMLDLYEEWNRKPDVTGTLPGGELQRMECRSWLRDGEVFVNHIEGTRPGLDGPVPYWVELVESDHCPHELRDERRRIVQGVEVNAYNRPRAYHFFRNHPGDLNNHTTILEDTRRVPAERVTHLKFCRRVPQFRGVTVFHAVMKRLEDIKDLEDAERISARVQAAFSWAITKDPQVPFTNVNVDQKRSQLQMSPGVGFELAPGEDVRMLDARRPNDKMADFVTDQKRSVAGGTGASFSEFARKFDGNYSSQRQELVYQDGVYGRLRSYYVQVSLAERYRRFAGWALASGAVTIPAGVDRSTLFKAEFIPPGMAWVDPLKEVQADALAIEKRLTSRRQVIRKRGGNPDQVDREIEQEAAGAPPPESNEDAATNDDRARRLSTS